MKKTWFLRIVKNGVIRFCKWTLQKYIQSCEKERTPYWIPWFSVSGHNKKIIWSLAGLKTTHEIEHHAIIYLTKSRPKWKSHGWQTKDSLSVNIGIKRLNNGQTLLFKYLWLTDHQQVWAPVLAVCWSGAFRCVTQKRKDVSNDLREAMVAAINLGRVIWPFANNSKSIIPQWGKLFTSGRHSRPIFPGVDVPENSPMLRPYNSLTNCRQPKSYTSDSTGLS